MDNLFEDETDCKRVLREIYILRKLKHPCIVDLIEICMPNDPEKFDKIFVVLEFAETDLKKIIKSSINLSMEHIQTIIYNTLTALKYLHESKIIHRDIKPANILVNEDCTVKLCDFGLARSYLGVEYDKKFIKEEEHESIDKNIQVKLSLQYETNSE